jgi:hypothetical protein
MVGSENQWSSSSDTPSLEKGDWVSQFHNNGYEPTYTNSPQSHPSMGLKPEDIPIPSIEDSLSHEPHRIVFVLPKLHTIRWCVRILSILVTVIAVILILVAIGLYNHAKRYIFDSLRIKLINPFTACQITTWTELRREIRILLQSLTFHVWFLLQWEQ